MQILLEIPQSRPEDAEHHQGERSESVGACYQRKGRVLKKSSMATFARWIMAYPPGIKLVRVQPVLASPVERREGLVEQVDPPGSGH